MLRQLTSEDIKHQLIIIIDRDVKSVHAGILLFTCFVVVDVDVVAFYGLGPSAVCWLQCAPIRLARL